MTYLTIASTFAIGLGLAGTVPHIRAMTRARSSHGQSFAGWLIGVSVNLLTGYINLVGLGATLLGVGNLLAASLSAAALACVVRFRRPPASAPAAPEPADPRPVVAFHELPTGELVAIKALAEEEHARRAAARAAAAGAASAAPALLGPAAPAGPSAPAAAGLGQVNAGSYA